MQVHVPWRSGRSKPFTSIPRINWAHPLAKGLVTYCIDLGGGTVIDLVNGSAAVLKQLGSPTLPTIKSSRYGNTNWQLAAQATGGGSGTTSACLQWPINTRFDNLSGAAPFSFASGFMQTTASTITGYFMVCGSSSSTTFGIGVNASNQPQIAYNNNGHTNPSTRAYLQNQFTTIVAASTASTTGQFWYLDDSTYFEQQANIVTPANINLANNLMEFGDAQGNPLVAAASWCTFSGQVFYGAGWKGRALTVADARTLHDDPWCFLWWPEDDIFAMIGGATLLLQSRLLMM